MQVIQGRVAARSEQEAIIEVFRKTRTWVFTLKRAPVQPFEKQGVIWWEFVADINQEKTKS